jgi:hypothetical protein
LYRLDGADRITGAEWVEATDDSEALEQSKERSPRFELWERNRLVHSTRGGAGENRD